MNERLQNVFLFFLQMSKVQGKYNSKKVILWESLRDIDIPVIVIQYALAGKRRPKRGLETRILGTM